MYSEIYYYNLDGSLQKTTIEKFKSTHCNCCHEIRDVKGLNVEVRCARSMVENYVFIECCGEKYFFNIYNAKINLKERLENFQKLESLRVQQTISRDVFKKIGNVSFVSNIIRQLEEQDSWRHTT